MRGPQGAADWHPEVLMEKTQKLTSHKEEGGELASGLPVVPAPALGAAGEAGRSALAENNAMTLPCQKTSSPIHSSVLTHSFLRSADILGASTLCQALC